MTKGQVVTVYLYGGGTAQRRVVADRPNVVVVCTEEEYHRAEIEGREPEGVGFPIQDVVVGDVSRKSADRVHSRGSGERRSHAGD